MSGLANGAVSEVTPPINTEGTPSFILFAPFPLSPIGPLYLMFDWFITGEPIVKPNPPPPPAAPGGPCKSIVVISQTAKVPLYSQTCPLNCK